MPDLALVTGGAGFIGSHIVHRLLREGYAVRVLDNFCSGSRGNLEAAQGSLEVMEGDVRSAADCERACRDARLVFHLAALVSVVASVQDPPGSHAVNVTGTLNLLEAARRAGAKRLVFSSSAAVYGNAESAPTPESATPDPQSPYASDKASAEFYCRNYQSLYGLETVILRYFNVFGPRQNVTSGYAAVIPAFINAARERRSPVIFGDGLQTRDFVYVENVAEANLLAAFTPGIAGETFNIAGGQGTSLLDLLALLRSLSGAPLEPEFAPARPGEVRHSRADISRAADRLAFRPRISLEEGLRRTLAAAG